MTSPSKNELTIQQLFDLSGKVALITGGAGHLGRSMSVALAEAGASVVVSSREESRATAVADGLPCVGEAQHFGIAIDHLDPDSIRLGFQQALTGAGQVDVLINNGLEVLGNDLTSCTFQQFAEHQANNAGYFELARFVRDHAVIRKTQASIVLVGSMYGMVGSYPDVYAGVGNASPVAYQALKGGTLQMARHLAVYWATDSVRVNSLSPGPFPGSAAPEALVSRLATHSPMGRIGQPQELKGAVVFLASEASSYVTGQNLVVDGGWTAW
ncbi:MAG: SDR family oxidoreductase [Pirellulales bacterium]|nr:SDR family oxidoreductase [Pirellulales bacterium]